MKKSSEFLKHATSFIEKLTQYILKKVDIGLVRLENHPEPEYLDYFHQLFPKSDSYKIREQAYEHFLSLLEIITLAALTVLSLSNLVSIAPSVIFAASICVLVSLIPLVLKPFFSIYNAINENQKINHLQKMGIIDLSSPAGGKLDETLRFSKTLHLLKYKETFLALSALKTQFDTASTLLNILKNALNDDNFREEAALSQEIQQTLLPQYLQDSGPNHHKLETLITHYSWLQSQDLNKEPETNTNLNESTEIETIWENYTSYIDSLTASTCLAFNISNQIIENTSLLSKLENDSQLQQNLTKIKDLQDKFEVYKAAQRNNPGPHNSFDQRALYSELHATLQSVQHSIYEHNRTTSMAAQMIPRKQPIDFIKHAFQAFASLLPQLKLPNNPTEYQSIFSNQSFFSTPPSPSKRKSPRPPILR